MQIKLAVGAISVCGTMLVSAASGNPVLHSDAVAIDTWSQVLDFDSTFTNDNQIFTSLNTGLNQNASITSSLSYGGWVGQGTSLHNTSYTPANPGLSGVFFGHTAVNINFVNVTGTASPWAEYAGAATYGWVQFSVSQPTAWSISGTAVGTTNAASSGWSEAFHHIRLYDWFNNSYLLNTSTLALNGVGNYTDNFSYGGVLAPGLYTYDYRSWAQHGGWDNSPTVLGNTSATLLINLSLTKVPAPGSAGACVVALGLVARRRR
ncbi:MAG: hypothetical protein KF757_06345 [Phycisphaeraceae bacterium]|nr:hypothetical protein [Phycisphaeraceae bacterium]MCW5763223.1 hypothetical protein [Phycisphaeraceae bacterium]